MADISQAVAAVVEQLPQRTARSCPSALLPIHAIESVIPKFHQPVEGEHPFGELAVEQRVVVPNDRKVRNQHQATQGRDSVRRHAHRQTRRAPLPERVQERVQSRVVTPLVLVVSNVVLASFGKHATLGLGIFLPRKEGKV